MPRKSAAAIEEIEEEPLDEIPSGKNNEDEIDNLNRMLAAVLKYLSDDEVEELDFEYLLNTTEGLKEWWENYRESNRKLIEDEIKLSLADLSLKELEIIREKVRKAEVH